MFRLPVTWVCLRRVVRLMLVMTAVMCVLLIDILRQVVRLWIRCGMLLWKLLHPLI